jgi:hypothetical protein
MNEQEINSRFEVIEKRLDILESKKNIIQTEQAEGKDKKGYKKGSTIDRIITLVNEGVFDKPKKITEIIAELKLKDYHLKASDLTLPLRRIVRKNILERTKKYPDNSESKKWMYIKK